MYIPKEGLAFLRLCLGTCNVITKINKKGRRRGQLSSSSSRLSSRISPRLASPPPPPPRRLVSPALPSSSRSSRHISLLLLLLLVSSLFLIVLPLFLVLVPSPFFLLVSPFLLLLSSLSSRLSSSSSHLSSSSFPLSSLVSLRLRVVALLPSLSVMQSSCYRHPRAMRSGPHPSRKGRGGCGWNSPFCSCWGVCDPVPGLCCMIRHPGWAIANLLTHLAGLLHHEFPFVLSYIVPRPNVHLEPYSGRK
jgi:hypothetical protein